jgi:glycosyltransferase involved in cell wall biosynthesis
MQISVVIPAYEEAARLGASLERVLAYLEARGDDFEVLVVDDGSRDATAAAAEAFAARGVRVLRLPENRGKGAALRTGVLASRGRRVLLTDADLSTPIADLTVDRFAYDVELLWLARRRGHRVAEVGVRWSNSPQSRVSPLRDSLQMLGDLVTMRWRHRGEGR